MKVLHIIPTLSPEHGGPSESVWRLVNGLQQQRLADVSLWTTDVDTSIKHIDQCQKQFPSAVFFGGLRRPLKEFSVDFTAELLRHAKQFELIHIHSVFNYISLVSASICLRRKIPYVISPRGMFQPWSLKQNEFAKKLYRLAILDRHVRGARGVHATSALEMESLQREFPSARIANIPNPLPQMHGSAPPFLERFPEFKNKRILLYLSRIHPKKGVIELLEAWRRVTDDFPAWHLVLIGPGRPAHVKVMQTSITRLNLSQRVAWLGPLFGAERDEAYRAAELFIQPSFQENFGNSIAEALASSCPVITTRETPWKILEERQWGWWVPMSVESLTATLREALPLSSAKLKAKGTAAKAWIQTECSIESVAIQMADWYRHLLKVQNVGDAKNEH